MPIAKTLTALTQISYDIGCIRISIRKGNFIMKKISSLFSTPKKAAISIICMAAVLIVLCTGAALALTRAGAGAQITLEEAEKKALSDAGLSISEVTSINTHLDLDDGIAVYDVEFYTEDMKYEYEINANMGNIYSKSKEMLVTQAIVQNENQQDANQQDANRQDTNPQDANQQDANQQDANQQDTNPHDANQGNDALQGTDTQQGSDVQQGSDARNEGQSVYNKDVENDKAGIGQSGDSTGQYGNPTGQSGNSDDSGNYIGVDSAKSIAAKHAGFVLADVTFTQAEIDRDDGQIVYEIEFYKDGREYEYTINAANGDIIEYEIDMD